MRQNYRVRSGRDRLLAIGAEAVVRGKGVGRAVLVARKVSGRYLTSIRKGVHSLAAALGVGTLLGAFAIASLFEASYGLRMILLVSFVVAVSLWVAQDVVPLDRGVKTLTHEQIGFGVAVIVLAVGAAGSFILRDTNFWLLASFSALILGKSGATAYRRGNASVYTNEFLEILPHEKREDENGDE